ncbi:MAG TPA: non-ribosomal peptide synthetase [Steroidobacteraceae bacterium]|nr:non-ribosomal peptide synthetase [Steroidobacteraceae bacterium]
MKFQTLADMLENHRSAERNITYFAAEGAERKVSFGQLYERGLGILHHLQKLGARPGDKLILFIGDNEQFIDAFWAAILGGIIPVPVAIGISDEHRHKLLRIARKLGAPYLYSDRKTLDRIAAFTDKADAKTVDGATFAALKARTFLVDQLDDISRAGKRHKAVSGDTAFVQFSSGSTSDPKGVVLTHANLLANIRQATEAAGFNEDDVSLSWMPLTHDMGLIGMYLIMLANRVEIALMQTELFIRRPLLWLTLATRIHATVLCSPNFGYRHYLKVLGERTPEGLDLKSVRVLFNGAEPISVELCREFVERMTPVGLAATAMYPVYGLAEASLAVSFPTRGSVWESTAFDRHQLGVGQSVARVAADSRDALALVSVGRPISDCELRLADDADAAVGGGHVGHIQIRGPNVTGGYFEAPEINANSFAAGGWLRTGDLGVMLDDRLFITGRAKELIILNGQNYYPHDLESIAERAPGLELGKVVATGCRSRASKGEDLVIFVLHRSGMADFLPTALAVARLVNEEAGLEVAEVVPVKRIPKTTSGKIQRHLLEQSYGEGEFDTELTELHALRAAHKGSGTDAGSEVARQLKAICDTALEGKRVDLDDNLFEIGASSLKLIEIHEQIDRIWPGKVDLTDIFDFPTIAELAKHLEAKLSPLP